MLKKASSHRSRLLRPQLFPADCHLNSTLAVPLTLLFIIGCFACINLSCQPAQKKEISTEETWISLFNGRDLSGWDIKISGYPLKENYKNTFVAEDSMIRIRYDAYETFGDAFGHMYYEQPFSYYKLRFDYRFLGDQLRGGASWNVRNSGIMLHSQSAASNELGQDFPVSVELQLLGGLGTGERTTANVCTPGTAVEMNDTINYNHCINSNSATYDGDQWVHAEAIVLGGESMHFIVEGDTVLQFQRPQVGGGFISEEDGVSDWESFGIVRDGQIWQAKVGEVLTEGYIALQAESHPIDFKNIELLNLCGCTDPKAKNYKSYYIKADPAACEY
jgi:hypothetical protein